MAIRRASKSSISTLGAGKRFNLIAGYSPAVDEMDLIERITLSSTQSSAIFSNIPQTYQHLQIRSSVLAASTGNALCIRFNSSASGYASHGLLGNGSSTTAAATTALAFIYWAVPVATAPSQPGVGITNIFEYTSTVKNKVVSSISGLDQNGSGALYVTSGVWASTSAITSIRLDIDIYNMAQNTTFSLYGITG